MGELFLVSYRLEISLYMHETSQRFDKLHIVKAADQTEASDKVFEYYRNKDVEFERYHSVKINYVHGIL